MMLSMKLFLIALLGLSFLSVFIFNAYGYKVNQHLTPQ